MAKSEDLKTHLDHLERLPENHADYCYQWFSDLIDNLIEKKQKMENQHSLILEASGKEQQPKKPTAPGLRQGGGGGGQGGGAGGGGKDSKGGKGDKGGKGGKGGKGDKDGKGGKGKGDWHSGNTGSENDTSKKPRKATKDFKGTELDSVPESERC